MGKSLSYQARREVLQQVAPQYREAPSSQKRTVLDAFVATTGYHRTYARWLLNHAGEVQQTHGRSHLRKYGPDVQHALFLAWHAANRICAKRLIPFLPTLIEALERHEHLQISEECRRQLLSMSAATVDRLLRSQRRLGQHGLSTTRAGTLLKQQIPIRTFEEWNEARPGFLEADLVAHCGTDIEGGYLYTLTLTDVATGWTECLPLLYRSQETVLAALQQARVLFPFPILGIDTDNGGEFINDSLMAYCEQEQITFTRGRPYLKNDQCFVEQKNGAIVRQVVGYDRLVGEQAYRQLTELYREQERRKRVLGWRRTHKDPFEGEWEQIFSWLVANPERSSGDIFRELQRRSPGRYQPLQIRTLQRGMRKIRAQLLETRKEQWQEEVIRGPTPTPIAPAERTTRSS